MSNSIIDKYLLTDTCHSGLHRIGARSAIPRSQFCYPTPKTQEITCSRWDASILDTGERTECCGNTVQTNSQYMA